MPDESTLGDRIRRGLEAAAELLPQREELSRTRVWGWVSRVVQGAVDAPVVVGRARHALSPHALRPPALVTRLRRLGGNGTTPDLSGEVTVFVTTVGRSTYPAVDQALAAQDCAFTGPEVIKNVSPWPRAFSLMGERSETPLVVQVDEDMILKPYAVRYLHALISEAPARVAMICCPLWDSHLQRLIQGVKIWRREVLRRYPYREGAAPSIDLVSRLEQDGFSCQFLNPTDYLGREVDRDPNREEVLGEHRVEGRKLLFDRFYSLFSSYQRYTETDDTGKDLGLFLRRLGLDRELENPNLWALFGAVAGLANPRRANDHYQSRRSLPGFRHLRPLVNRGPEEVGLLLGVPGHEDASARELQRLCSLFPSIRSARLLGAPFSSPALTGVLEEAQRRGLRVVVETPAVAPPDAAALEVLEASTGSVEVLLIARDLAVDEGVVHVLRDARVPRTLRVVVERRDLLEDARHDRLIAMLERALVTCDEVEVEHPLPRDSEQLDWERVVRKEDEQAVARLAKLPEGVRLPAPLAAQEDGRCDSPFRGLVVDGRGDLSGCLAGVIRPDPEHWTIYRGTPDEIWFERHLRRLRNELSGKAAPRVECRRCPRNC